MSCIYTEIKNIESKIRINQLKYSCILPQSGIAFLSISETPIRMKDGNKNVRWILIHVAITAARKDDRLRKFYLRIAKRYSHRIAITHVTIKMIKIIWHMPQHLHDKSIKT